uniref:Ig-like domain-containing protein n=2 Tax=Echeneis naucrates TaxID=173247 RepID=A0A665TFY8_ECHNA
MDCESGLPASFLWTAAVLVILHSSAGDSDLICYDQPIIALIGNDVTLPCHLQPGINVIDWRVEWTKPGLDPQHVHVHEEGRMLYQTQNPSFSLRTRLFMDELLQGNVSMMIFRVTLSDEGTYRCTIPSAHKEALVHLRVGSVSSPAVTSLNISSGGVVLRCESAGWYPEPELLWLDDEGNVLSTGPPESVRGPDGLYTVRRNLSVDQTHRRNFICRVQQEKINQNRETHFNITVPDDFFPTVSRSTFRICVTLVPVLFLVCCIVIGFLLIRSKLNNKHETRQKEKQPEVVFLTEAETENPDSDQQIQISNPDSFSIRGRKTSRGRNHTRPLT